MCSNKVLTIGIAAYNAAKDIERCLSSLLIPSILNDIEILVINDGSSDETASLVRRFEKKYPKVVKLVNKKNGGHGSTINKTIELASGNYLKMIDSDDSVEKNGIVSLVNNLKITNADLVFSPYYRVDVRTGKKQEVGYLINSERLSFTKKTSNISTYANNLKVAMHSITYRTKILRDSKYRIDEHCFYVDVEYTIFYLLGVKKILMLSEPVYDYCIGSADQSVNIDNMRARRNQHLKVTKSLVHFYEIEKQNMTPDMSVFIENNIINMILSTEYKLLMSIKSTQTSYQELVQFDNYLRSKSPTLYYDVIHEKSKKIKIVSIFRKINFRGYSIFHKLLQKKLTNNL